MDFKQSLETCLRTKYADFSGRASRSEYWWFILGMLIVNVVIQLIGRAVPVLGLVLPIIFFLAVIVPDIAVSVRRLHDTGKSGWFLLLALIPLVGAIVLLVFFVLPSDPNANAYGQAP